MSGASNAGALGPGATIGIIGGGQLARMMALEARRMGYRIAAMDPAEDGSAAQVSDRFIRGRWDDAEAAEALAELADVITIDTEHVPADLLERLEGRRPVRPGASVLRVIQDRLAQRQFLARLGAPQPRHVAISGPADLAGVPAAVGLPCVLKTRRAGYDGKGQVRIDRADQVADAWEAVGRVPALVESFIPFEREVSALLARGVGGEVRFYPVAENLHRRHILHTTRVPARIAPALATAAQELGARIAAALDHVGMMAVELFVTREQELLVNEIAPRTHNSGHFTFGACATSQFEQHVRAVCGLPLGDPALLRPAVMVNLLGDLWQAGEPPWGAILARPEARLHLYGKAPPAPGRKMGHVLVLDDDPDRAMASAEAMFAALEGERRGG